MSLSESERIISLLKNAIRLSNYTYRDVERQLGWRVGTITRLLRGGLGLKIEYLLSILRVVNLSPARLFAAAYPPPSTAASPSEDRLFRLLEQLHGAAETGAASGIAPGPAPAFDSSAAVAGSKAAGAAAQADIDEMVQVSLRKLIGAVTPASGSSGGSSGGGPGTGGAGRDAEP
jgi:transcriptional regulator with XRE-family HTH domain